MVNLIKTYDIWYDDRRLDVVDFDITINTINNNKEVVYISVMYIDKNNNLSYANGKASEFEFIRKYA